MSTPHQKFGAVIFDLDGVLVDTAEMHYLGWKRLADELGVDFDRKKNDRLRGVDRMRSLGIVLEDCDRTPDNLDELADRKNGYYKEMIQTLSSKDLLPGASELLKALTERGVKIGLGSSSKNAKAVVASLGITDMFDAIVDGRDFIKAKPDPEVFVICADKLGAKPKECIVVEDAQAGIDAARAAGMYAVGICNGDRLNGAEVLFENVGEIPADLSFLPSN